MGEDTLVAGVVGEAGDDGGVVGERDGANPFAAGSGSVDEVVGEVGGVGSAASVAA